MTQAYLTKYNLAYKLIFVLVSKFPSVKAWCQLGSQHILTGTLSKSLGDNSHDNDGLSIYASFTQCCKYLCGIFSGNILLIEMTCLKS